MFGYRCLWAFIGLCVSAASVQAQSGETDLKIRFAHYDRNFSNNNNDRTQTGVGLQFSHERSFLNDNVDIGATFFHAQRLISSGAEVEDLLGADGNKTISFSQVGEAFLGIKLSANTYFKFGRFQHKSLLLKSKTRLLPSSFQGVAFEWKLGNSLTLNASQFSKWSRRANDSFVGFQTEFTDAGSIQHLNILNVKHSHQYGSTQLEVLNSNDYLNKLGIQSELTLPLKNDLSIELNGGIFSSHDAGDLFIAGASTLDSISSESQNGRLNHDGLGGYIQLGFAKKFDVFTHNFTLTHSRFGQAWLEDNFAGDHGTSPFPTSTMGPELSNNHERLWMVAYQLNKDSGFLDGFSNKISFTDGYGAFNALGEQFGTAAESWFEVDLRYRPKILQGFSARLRYRDYRSTEIGQIAGVKDDRDEWRFTVDYQYKFKF